MKCTACKSGMFMMKNLVVAPKVFPPSLSLDLTGLKMIKGKDHSNS